MKAPHKIKGKTNIWPSNSTSGCLSEKIQNTNLKRYAHPYVHCSIIYNSLDLEATWLSINKCMDKDVIYKYIFNIKIYIYKYIFNTYMYICIKYAFIYKIFIYMFIMKYYRAIKKNKILPFATTRMTLEGMLLSKVNQTEKVKYCMISLIRGI